MKTCAAVLQAIGRPQPYAKSRPLVVEDLVLEPPGAGEVLVEIKAAGLCHSDLSVITAIARARRRWRWGTRRQGSCASSARA
jgi:Zn-dependent alcohol dehydrogenase